ncbi:MAG: DUF2007 domain-containing protein [Hyphomicrobiales bacterium]|nr:DUF2007 domain-containing protein [Hyphomicrobiales bacterium]MDE2114308.1 DUF2007 domain-containing protein [Hyphomicrobiales bacterium]
MVELLRTNDIVLLSVIELVLKESSIHYFLADTQMSSIGFAEALQRRILVPQAQVIKARRLLVEAGLMEPPVAPA